MSSQHSTSVAFPFAPRLRQFRAALAVFQTGSTARAATLLPLSQSAIARAIRDLEDGLGVQFFDRTGRGMLATTEGQLLIRRTQRAFDQLELAQQEARASVGGQQGLKGAGGRFAVTCGYRHLQTYIVFCETRGETQAAARLGISQPAVNQTLRQLEHMLGAKLFHRSGAGARLTDGGEAVLRRAKLALDEFRLAQEDLAAYRGQVQGRIVVGSLPLSAGILVPRAVDKVLSVHKELSVTIVDGTYDALVHQLLHAEVDIIVGALRPKLPSPELKQEALFEDTLSVVARHGHPLLDAPVKDLRQLVTESWIAPLPGTPAREAFERAFKAEGISPPHASLEVNSAMVLQALLLDSDRLALLSRRQIMRGMSAGLLSVLPVPVNDTARVIGLTTRRDSHLGAAMMTFVNEVRKLADALA